MPVRPEITRQPAVIVQEVEAELGAVVEVRQIQLEVDAALAAVLGLARLDPVHVLEVRDERTAERAEIHALIRERAEAEQHALAARRREIVRTEESTRRLGLGVVPVEQIDELRRQVLAELQVEDGHFLRQEGLFQLRARHAQRRDVEMIDGVEATLDERALTPAQHLTAEPQLRGHRAEIEARVAEGIEQAGVLPRRDPSRTSTAACAGCRRPWSRRS